MFEFMQAAIQLANLGYRVFPCKPGDKTPMTPNGCLDATTDETTIGDWWGKTRNANIGLSTDGLFVIDVDPLKDGTKNTFADDIDRLSDLLEAGYGTATPRGGQHFWFRQTPGQDLRNTAGKIAEGVDTRGNGGYVLVPPSVTSAGKYQWMVGYELDSSPDFLPPVPKWVVDLLDDNRVKIDTSIVDDGESIIIDGVRNQTLTSIAGKFREIGCSQKTIESALLRINIERCRPQLSHEEVCKIAWSVSRYQPDQTAQAVAEGWYDQQETRKPKTKMKHPGTLPGSLLNPGGLMGDVIRWSLDTAYKPQPELTLAATLCLMSTITGRKIADTTGLRTNLYCMALCESGGGKEHTRKVNKEIMRDSGLSKMVGPEGFGSANGILSCLNANPVQLFQVDEFGRFMNTTKSAAKNPFLYGVPSVLLKLFTAADSVYKGDAVKDLKQIPEIDQPHAVLYATTVAESFYESLSHDSLTDGFVSRLLLFEGLKNDPDSQETDKQRPPQSIVDQVRWWGAFSPGGNLSCEIPQPKMLKQTPESKAVFRELDIACRANVKTDRPTRRLWSRTVEKAKKLALLHAVSVFRDADVIDAPSAEWGCQMASYLTQRMEFLCLDHVAENPYEAQLLRVKRIVSQAGPIGISANELTAKTRWIQSRQKNEILNSLIESGDISKKTENHPGAGRPVTVFFDTEQTEEKNTPSDTGI